MIWSPFGKREKTAEGQSGATAIEPALKAAGVNAADLPHVTAIFNFPAFLAVLLVSVILVIGVRESANFNVVAVFIKVATVIIFIIIAANFLWHNPQVAAANWHPFIPENKGHFGEYGWSGIARGASTSQSSRPEPGCAAHYNFYCRSSSRD